jgi:hypothetical protein
MSPPRIAPKFDAVDRSASPPATLIAAAATDAGQLIPLFTK